MPAPYKEPHYTEFVKHPYERQPAVGDDPFRWAEKYEVKGIPEQDRLPRNKLYRCQVREICRDLQQPVLVGYACAMAWGWQGKGPGGKRSVKASWAQHWKIAASLVHLREGGLTRCEAYDLFCNAGEVNGLGPAYFTKLLYFFSAENNCYIMDQWTGKSINMLTGDKVVRLYDSSPTRANTGQNYERFCAEIEHLARACEQSGDQIEQQLFSKGGKKPSPWRKYVKQHYR